MRKLFISSYRLLMINFISAQSSIMDFYNAKEKAMKQTELGTTIQIGAFDINDGTFKVIKN